MQNYDNTVAKVLCNNLSSLRLYANHMFQPCQLKVTVEGQLFEQLISCLHYVSFNFDKLKWFLQ